MSATNENEVVKQINHSFFGLFHSSEMQICSLSLLQYGTTPLIWAARKGHFDCVMHLLENGADVDQEGAVRPHSL